MVKDYDSMLGKELIFGSGAKPIVEIGNNREADEEFQMTVSGLD
jgi:hypothetical protein